jgi:mRNA interferase MazF
MGRRGLGGAGCAAVRSAGTRFAQPDKRRPVLLLTRDAVIDSINEIIVVPATRTIRGLATEVVLAPEDGVPVVCALNFDHIDLAQRARLGPVLSTLRLERWPEVERALLHAATASPSTTISPSPTGPPSFQAPPAHPHSSTASSTAPTSSRSRATATEQAKGDALSALHGARSSARGAAASRKAARFQILSARIGSFARL